MWIRRNLTLQGSEKHRQLRNIFRGHYNFVFDSEMGEAAGYLECLAICLPAYLPTSYLPTYLPTYLLPAYLPPTYLPPTCLPTYTPSYLPTYLPIYLLLPCYCLHVPIQLPIRSLELPANHILLSFYLSPWLLTELSANLLNYLIYPPASACLHTYLYHLPTSNPKRFSLRCVPRTLLYKSEKKCYSNEKCFSL